MMKKAEFEFIELTKKLRKEEMKYRTAKLFIELHKKRLPVLKRNITNIKNKLQPYLSGY